ncbi:MAG: hypothetical protein ABSA41_02080 [Terriglobia bacterium]|jgi:hypothetical protein
MTKGGGSEITFRSILRRQCFFHLAVIILGLVPCVYAVLAQDSRPIARLAFTKSLKGSVPEYVALSVDANSQGTYDGRKLADAPSPRPLQISPATTQRLFSLAESLGYFRSLTLESRHKVANLGQKTLTYEAGGQVSRVQFNYTENRTAQQLTDLFERISNVEEHIAQLDYAIKYDPLSLPQQLRQIQIELDEHSLLETELLVPTLEKIVSNPRFLHLAQSRAQEILKRIQENN